MDKPTNSMNANDADASAGNDYRSSIVSQPIGEMFQWPKSVRLRAIDPLIIALPSALIANDEPIGSVILGDDDVEIGMPPGEDRILLRFQKGTTVWLTKASQACLVGEDDDLAPKKIEVLKTEL